MRKILLVLSMFPHLLLAQTNTGNPVVKLKTSAKISIEDLKAFGYGSNNHQADRNKQPIANEKDAEGFLAKLGTRINNTDISYYLKQNLTSYKNGTAILFFQQPFDLKKLYGGDQSETLNSQYKNACVEEKKLANQLKNIETKINELDETISKKGSNALTTSFIDDYNRIILMKTSFLSQIEKLNEKMKELNTRYSEQRDQIVQLEKIDHFVLNKEKNENSETDFSSYLLEKDDILVVLLGGDNFLALSNIKIENRPSSFQVSLSDFATLAAEVGSPLPKFHDASTCNLSPPEDSLTITFLYLQRNKFNFPSTIKLENEKLTEPIDISIHEKTFIGLRVGVSVLTNVDRKQFLIEDNELTVKLDTAQQTEWKTNLMTFFEVYPFGRDIDRIGSVFDKGGLKNLEQRIGLTCGVRLSKNPLETFFLGGSLALTRDFTVVVGAALNQIPEDVNSQPIGENISVDYLKENARKKREVNFFFGLSLSPGGMLKTLGLKKN